MKNPIKSVLSCTLSLALCVCFLPASAFAVEEPAEPVTAGESPATNGESVTTTKSPDTLESIEMDEALKNGGEVPIGVNSEADGAEKRIDVRGQGSETSSIEDEGAPKYKVNWTVSGGCQWSLIENTDPLPESDGNKSALTLIIKPKGDSNEGALENWDISGEGGKPIAPPWIGKDDGAYVKQITHVKIEKGVTALTTRDMFLGCANLTKIEGLSNLDVSTVKNMSATFGDCSSLTSLDLSDWNTSAATTMERMFAQCSNLETIEWSSGESPKWSTASVTDMSQMFENCRSLATADVSDFNTTSVKYMTNMFADCRSLSSIDVSSWSSSALKETRCMFYGCKLLGKLEFGTNWTAAQIEDMTAMFAYCTNLKSISGLGNWEMKNGTKMNESKQVETKDSSGNIKLVYVTGPDGNQIPLMTSYGLFAGCRSLTDLSGIAAWNMEGVSDLSCMFADCRSLASLNISGWDTSGVTKMPYLFYGCSSLIELDFINKNTNLSWSTNNVTDMTSMFGYCTKLKTIHGLDTWDTSKVEKVYELAPARDDETGAIIPGRFSNNGLFTGCSSLESVTSLSGWDVKNMKDMSFMFSGCASLHDISALSGWTINEAAIMKDMFNYCPITTMKFGSGWQGKLSTDLFSIGSTATWDSGNNAEALTTGELIKKLNSGNGLDQTWHKWNTEGFVIEYIPDQLFTGKDITPVPKVTCNGKLLKQGTDYTVKYANNRDKGRATVTVTGNGAYYGEKTASFQIYKLDFKGAAITAPAPQVHTGKAVTPAIEVKYNGKLLKQGTDYTVKYANNTDVGTANFTVTGMGSYDGSQAYTFQIIPDPATRQVMYRAYNPNSGEHFYTASFSEVESVVAAGWTYEGEAWIAPVTSATPVYRLYSGTDHHYTTSKAEKDHLVSVGWRYEGVGWYSDDAKGTALHRLFNPNVNPTAPTNNSGSHHYTTSAAERDHLVSVGWRYEGHGWYGVE